MLWLASFSAASLSWRASSSAADGALGVAAFGATAAGGAVSSLGVDAQPTKPTANKPAMPIKRKFTMLPSEKSGNGFAQQRCALANPVPCDTFYVFETTLFANIICGPVFCNGLPYGLPCPRIADECF